MSKEEFIQWLVMKQLQCMLRLAILFPSEKWRTFIWRAWFEKRVVLVWITPIRLEQAAAVANEELTKAFDMQEKEFVNSVLARCENLN